LLGVSSLKRKFCYSRFRDDETWFVSEIFLLLLCIGFARRLEDDLRELDETAKKKA